jgi:hypothetical protein
VAHVHRRRLRKAQAGGCGVEKMLSVNDIGRIGEERQVVDDWRCRGAQLGRDVAESGAVGDGLVTAPPQSDRQVPDVEFAPASIRKIGIGQEDTQVFILLVERVAAWALRREGAAEVVPYLPTAPTPTARAGECVRGFRRIKFSASERGLRSPRERPRAAAPRKHTRRSSAFRPISVAKRGFFVRRRSG